MTDTRNIILIGRTGGGKSTLGNVLVNKNDNFDEAFEESAGGASKTKRVEERTFEVNLSEDGNEKIKYRVIDTIGLGDTNLTPQGVLIRLAEIADRVKREGVNQILFVNKGRFTKEEIEAYDLLSSIIFDKEVLKYTTVVRVAFPNFEEKEACDKDREELREQNAKLAHILRSVNIIYLDNPPLEGRPRMIEMNKEVREESRKRILTYLGKCKGNYLPSNIDTLDERVREYKTDEQKLKDKMKELEKIRKEQEEKFRKEMAELKEHQAKELKEVKEKSEESIRKVKVEGEENLRRTKNEMEDTHRREMADHDRRNEEKVQGLKTNYEREAKSIKDAAAQQAQNLQNEMQRDRSKIDSLERQLSEQKNSSNAETLAMMAKMEESARIREDKAEERRLKYEQHRDDQEREFKQKMLDAENKRIQADKDREVQRRKDEDKKEENRRQEEANRLKLERKKANMDARWKKWEADNKAYLQEQESKFLGIGRDDNWRQGLTKPSSNLDDYDY